MASEQPLLGILERVQLFSTGSLCSTRHLQQAEYIDLETKFGPTLATVSYSLVKLIYKR